MAKPKGSKLVKCSTCATRFFLLPGTYKTCKCGTAVGADTKPPEVPVSDGYGGVER